MRNSIGYARFAQLCGKPSIMHKIMRVHNHIILRSLVYHNIIIFYQKKQLLTLAQCCNNAAAMKYTCIYLGCCNWMWRRHWQVSTLSLIIIAYHVFHLPWYFAIISVNERFTQMYSVETIINLHVTGKQAANVAVAWTRQAITYVVMTSLFDIETQKLKPRLHDTAGCQNGCTTRFDNRLYRVNGGLECWLNTPPFCAEWRSGKQITGPKQLQRNVLLNRLHRNSRVRSLVDFCRFSQNFSEQALLVLKKNQSRSQSRFSAQWGTKHVYYFSRGTFLLLDATLARYMPLSGVCLSVIHTPVLYPNAPLHASPHAANAAW